MTAGRQTFLHLLHEGRSEVSRRKSLASGVFWVAKDRLGGGTERIVQPRNACQKTNKVEPRVYL